MRSTCSIVSDVQRVVPEVGLEPTWALSPLDFESSAYTNFATPARTKNNKHLQARGQETAGPPALGQFEPE